MNVTYAQEVLHILNVSVLCVEQLLRDVCTPLLDLLRGLGCELPARGARCVKLLRQLGSRGAGRRRVGGPRRCREVQALGGAVRGGRRRGDVEVKRLVDGLHTYVLGRAHYKVVRGELLGLAIALALSVLPVLTLV